MNRSFGIVAFAALFAGPVLAQQAAPTKPDSTPLDAIVGIVGDTAFTRYDVEEQYFGQVQTMQSKGLTVPTREAALAILDTVVNTMIDNMVLLAKAKEYKINVPDIALTAKVDAQIKAARAQYPTEAAFQEDLVKAGLGTPDDFRRFKLEQARTDTILPMVYDSLRAENRITPVNVTEAEVDSVYTKEMSGPNAPHRPPMVQFRQLILAPVTSPASKVAARAKAESLLVLIKAGASFDSLAKLYSMGPNKDQGGDLGPQPRGKAVPEVDKLLFGSFPLKPGQVSPVTQTALGFDIIRVDKANSTEVSAHELLIRPLIDSLDMGRTQQLADSIAAQVRRRVPFDSLAKRYNDYAGRDAGLMGSTFFDGLPPVYRKALGESPKPGDVDVFSIPWQMGAPKFGILEVVKFEEGGPYTLDDARENIRAGLSQQAAIRRVLDGMRKQIYIRLDMARVRSILDALPPGI